MSHAGLGKNSVPVPSTVIAGPNNAPEFLVFDDNDPANVIVTPMSVPISVAINSGMNNLAVSGDLLATADGKDLNLPAGDRPAHTPDVIA